MILQGLNKQGKREKELINTKEQNTAEQTKGNVLIPKKSFGIFEFGKELADYLSHGVNYKECSRTPLDDCYCYIFEHDLEVESDAICDEGYEPGHPKVWSVKSETSCVLNGVELIDMPFKKFLKTFSLVPDNPYGEIDYFENSPCHIRTSYYFAQLAIRIEVCLGRIKLVAARSSMSTYANELIPKKSFGIFEFGKEIALYFNQGLKYEESYRSSTDGSIIYSFQNHLDVSTDDVNDEGYKIGHPKVSAVYSEASCVLNGVELIDMPFNKFLETFSLIPDDPEGKVSYNDPCPGRKLTIFDFNQLSICIGVWRGRIKNVLAMESFD